MNKYLFYGFILGQLIPLFGDLLCEPIRNKWRKDCNYDCSKCKVWDCNVYNCKKFADKLNNMEDKWN